VTTIGLSTAVLSVTGVASADMARDFTFSTDQDSDADVLIDPDDSMLQVSDAFCSISWDVTGGSGGKDSQGHDGNVAGRIAVTGEIDVPEDESLVFYLFPGTAGGDATASSVPGEDEGSVGAGGQNGQAYPGSAGSKYVGSDDAWFYGGGGGAASLVTVEPFLPPAVEGAAAGMYLQPLLGVPGGDGAGVDEEDGRGGGGPGNLNSTGGTPTVDGLATTPGDGVISGTVHLCGPGTPSTPETPETPSTPNTPSTPETPSTPNTPSTPETPTTPVPVVTVPAPAWGELKAGVQSLTFRWTPPADTTGLTGYSMEAYLQPSAGIDPATIPAGTPSVLSCTAPAGATSCTVAAAPGFTYKGYVAAQFGEQSSSTEPLTSGVVSAPATPAAAVPTASGTLTSDAKDGKVQAGKQVTVTGKDFLPGSSVDIVVYSTPVKLGTVVVLADGTFSYTVTLPADLANGTHHLVASGVDVNGDPRNLVVEVTVSGGTAVLAFTGFSALPVIGAGVLALGLGGGLLVASRRRAA
jgi:hypothetical protein